MAQISLKPTFIPKSKEKEPFWPNFGAYFSILLVVASVTAYAVFFTLSQSEDKRIRDLKTKINNVRTEENNWKEAELQKYKVKLDAFEYIAARHKKVSGVFDFLEKNILPEIFVASCKADLENNGLIFSGTAKDFKSLGQQLLIFQKEPLVAGVQLTETVLSKDKKVAFTFIVNLDSATYNFQEK